MKILGISAFYHDSAAALVVDGKILSAVQEERFTRKKHDSGFPINSINYCLSQANLDGSDIDYVVFYEKPFLKFDRLLETYFAFAPKGFLGFSKSMQTWLTEKLFQKSVIKRELRRNLGKHIDWDSKLLFSEHHLSHAASAFFPSPFQNAAVLTMDGVGEWTTTSLSIGRENTLTMMKEIKFPHSLGLLYSAFTFYAGFKVNSGEYKLMGLAPYGEPVYEKLILENLIDLKEDGSFRLDMKYFNYCTGETMTSEKFHTLFEGPPRKPESPLTQREMDIAASIQKVLELIVLRLVKNIAEQTGEKNLCLAGGVALNCVANGKIVQSGYFENVWIQPAAGDAGGALGAALAVHYLMLGESRQIVNGGDAMAGSYLGPEFSESEVILSLNAIGANFKILTQDEMVDATARALSLGQAVGWMQGRMEFGPRALGNRSILGDPRSPDTQKTLNLKVKFRESFRPFAPSILTQDLSDWFDLDVTSPYMLVNTNVSSAKRLQVSPRSEKLFGISKLNIPRSQVPAVTHIDYSARIQTVHLETNSLYFKLLTKFKEFTGVPIVVNTSFNVRGEPIVCTPGDAYRCFMGTDLDLLVIGNVVLEKNLQPIERTANYRDSYELD